MTWLGEQLGRIADDMPERDLGARAMAVHQRRRRNFRALTAAAVVVVTLIVITVGVRVLPAEPRAAARPSSPPELSAITVGVLPTVESAPVFVAMVRGYFQEEGLTVKTSIVSGAAAAMPQATSGRLDLAQSDYATLFQANAGGGDFKIAASLYQAAPGSFAVVVNAKSKIRTVADLKRKKVAVPNLVGLGRLALNAMLKRAGLTPKDVMLVETPYPDMISALGRGHTDAALLAEPFVTLGRDAGRTRIVADMMTREFANLYTAGMMATDQWVRENPRTLAAFQRALAKAQRLIASDPQQVRDVLPHYIKLSKAEAAGITFGSYPAKLNMTELQRVADLAHAHKMIKRPADLRSAVVQGG